MKHEVMNAVETASKKWGCKMNRTEKILDQLLEDINLALIKAKAQLEYVGGENEKK